MRVLLDVEHPATVHFFRHLWEDLVQDGHDVLVVSRDKEVTLPLLDRFGIPHEPVGRALTGSLLRRGGELVSRVAALLRYIRRFRPDVIATRNPAGTQAAWLGRVPAVFDTDDGTAVGIHFYAARPFAKVITTPSCLTEDFGSKHRRYPGFKAMAYLHPDRFEPDPRIRSQLRLAEDEPLFVVRFSAHSASHDSKIQGLSAETRRALVELLASRGRVVISDEGELSSEYHSMRFPLPPDRLHDALAAADLCVGDSQSVAAEAALLGTMAIRLSTFSDRVDYLRTLEERYGLIRNFMPGEESEFLDAVDDATSDLSELAGQVTEMHDALLSECVDVTSWFYDLLAEVVSEPNT